MARKLLDPVCEWCENREIGCITLCAPLTWINGHKARKEPLVTDLRNRYSESTENYNDVLSELINHRESSFDKITQISNIRRRAIAAMLLADISRNDIADLLQMSYRQLLRIINNNK